MYTCMLQYYGECQASQSPLPIQYCPNSGWASQRIHTHTHYTPQFTVRINLRGNLLATVQQHYIHVTHSVAQHRTSILENRSKLQTPYSITSRPAHETHLISRRPVVNGISISLRIKGVYSLNHARILHINLQSDSEKDTPNKRSGSTT
jgi:hypothetical protein